MNPSRDARRELRSHQRFSNLASLPGRTVNPELQWYHIKKYKLDKTTRYKTYNINDRYISSHHNIKHSVNLRLVAMYRSLLSNAALLLSVVVTVSFSIVENNCRDFLVLPLTDGGENDWQLHKSSRSSARDGISDSFMVVQ